MSVTYNREYTAVIRFTSAEKALLGQAAILQHRKRGDFIRHHSLLAARRILKRDEREALGGDNAGNAPPRDSWVPSGTW